MTPHGHQPRPSKHTIRVGEQRRDQRERERERERERDATAVRWARAVTGPLGLSLSTQGQTRDPDLRQLADLSVTECDHRHRHETRASDTS